MGCVAPEGKKISHIIRHTYTHTHTVTHTHTHRAGVTLMNEGSAVRRSCYLHNKTNRTDNICMLSAGFKPIFQQSSSFSFTL